MNNETLIPPKIDSPFNKPFFCWLFWGSSCFINCCLSAKFLGLESVLIRTTSYKGRVYSVFYVKSILKVNFLYASGINCFDKGMTWNMTEFYLTFHAFNVCKRIKYFLLFIFLWKKSIFVRDYLDFVSTYYY